MVDTVLTCESWGSLLKKDGGSTSNGWMGREALQPMVSKQHRNVIKAREGPRVTYGLFGTPSICPNGSWTPFKGFNQGSRTDAGMLRSTCKVEVHEGLWKVSENSGPKEFLLTQCFPS